MTIPLAVRNENIDPEFRSALAALQRRKAACSAAAAMVWGLIASGDFPQLVRTVEGWVGEMADMKAKIAGMEENLKDMERRAQSAIRASTRLKAQQRAEAKLACGQGATQFERFDHRITLDQEEEGQEAVPDAETTQKGKYKYCFYDRICAGVIPVRYDELHARPFVEYSCAHVDVA